MCGCVVAGAVATAPILKAAARRAIACLSQLLWRGWCLDTMNGARRCRIDEPDAGLQGLEERLRTVGQTLLSPALSYECSMLSL